MFSFCQQEYLQHILKISNNLRRVKGDLWEARSQWSGIGHALVLPDSTIHSTHMPNDGKAMIQDLLKTLDDQTISHRDIANEILILLCLLICL